MSKNTIQIKLPISGGSIIFRKPTRKEVLEFQKIKEEDFENLSDEEKVKKNDEIIASFIDSVIDLNGNKLDVDSEFFDSLYMDEIRIISEAFSELINGKNRIPCRAAKRKESDQD